MIILPIFFILSFFIIIIKYKKGAENSVTVSSPTQFPSPTIPQEQILISPNPVLDEIDNDLKKIETDIKKNRDDQRLNPPTFLLDLGIME